MTDTAFIDAENPFGALALEPIRRRLDNTSGQKIVSLPVFGVLIEGGQEHPGPEFKLSASLIGAGRPVRQT